MFGITIAQRNPRAEIVAVDWKPVLVVAEENARAAQAQERYRTIAGDAFKADFGTGYDVALVTNFLHHFDALTCRAFPGVSSLPHGSLCRSRPPRAANSNSASVGTRLFAHVA